MKVKLDTKEKFIVVLPEESTISANMAESLAEILLSNSKKNPPHIILNMQHVRELDPAAAIKLSEVYGLFLEKGLSMVICCVDKQIMAALDELDLTDILNITPTESEAWDIVQMEEIERELLGNDADNIDT
jgi:anti-anti-sigma regulatory factor